MHRAETDQGVTTGDSDINNFWKINWNGNTISLNSLNGEFLYRAESGKGVVTQKSGAGNNWSVEIVSSGKISVD